MKSIFRSTVLIMLAALVVHGAVSAEDMAAEQRDARIKVVFRIDDYSATSDYEQEKRLVELFARFGYPVTLAIIPMQEGKEIVGQRAESLRDWVARGIVEPALHGYAHSDNSKTGSPSEFVGLPQEEVKSLLTEGKTRLDAVVNAPVTAFVPPWNSYDQHTVTALEAAGFEVLSAGYGGARPENARLHFVPFTAFPHETMAAVRSARKADRPTAVIVLSHAFEFTDAEPNRDSMYGAQGSFSFEELEDLLAWLRRQPDVEVCTLKEVAAAVEITTDKNLDLHMKAYSAFQTSALAAVIEARRRLIPSGLMRPERDPLGFFLTLPPEGVKIGFPSDAMHWLRLVLPVVAIYAPLWLVAGLVVSFLIRKVRRRNLMPRWHLGAAAIAAVVLLVGLALILSFPFFGYKKSVVLMAVLGILSGVVPHVRISGQKQV